ncbi:MAG: DNA polymerase III subunit delta' [Polyangiales bacterium]
MPFRDILGQTHAVETLRRGLQRGRLHHALLFVGPDGVGKELTALALATAVVCTVAPGEGCGECAACHRALSSSSDESAKGASGAGGSIPLHPDVVIVERGLYSREVLGRTTEEKTDIAVDQIRRVVLEKMALTPHEAPQRIVIVRRAEELSIGAANALLKTLEEPPPHTRFVLVTARPGELLPTIRSRTQPLRFASLSDDIVEKLLIARGTDPTRAREVAKVSSGSIEVAMTLADPTAAMERLEAVTALRKASSGPLSTLLETTSSYANSGDDRIRLREHLAALVAEEATALRDMLREDGETVRPSSRQTDIDATLARATAATAVMAVLDRNANVPLALEAAWLTLKR